MYLIEPVIVLWHLQQLKRLAIDLGIDQMHSKEMSA